MSLSTSTVWFDIFPPCGRHCSCQVERCPTDSLSDLLEKLSEQTDISVEEFSFTYQLEFGKFEGENLRYYKENKQPISKRNGSVKWKTVYASDIVGSFLHVFPSSSMTTNNLISELDDVFCPPGLVPLISVGLSSVFFELDDANDFELIPRNADALWDPQNVALFQGLCLLDGKEETPSIVLLEKAGMTDEIRLVDMKSGESFESLEDVSIASRTSRESHKEQRCYILLRNKSRLPKWPISPDVELSIAIREGVDFSIAGGIIDMKESSSPVLSRRWIFPKWYPPLGISNDSKFLILGKQIVHYIGT